MSALLQVAKSPQQTLANEQYEIAKDLYFKGFFAESLHHLDQAISGFLDADGYPYDYRYHLLRGHIFLGSQRNFDPELVNPTEAVAAFSQAAKYAVSSDSSDQGEMTKTQSVCFGLAGWASYCDGQHDDAVRLFTKSLKNNPRNSSSYYNLAKSFLQLGRPMDAKPFFLAAIALDGRHGLSAAGDPDFLNQIGQTKEWINEIKEQLALKSSATISSVLEVLLNRNEEFEDILLNDESHSWKKIVSDGKEFQKMVEATSDLATLQGHLQDKIRLADALQITARSLSLHVKDRITNIEARPNETKAKVVEAPNERGSHTIGLAVGLLAFVIVLILAWNWVWGIREDWLVGSVSGASNTEAGIRRSFSGFVGFLTWVVVAGVGGALAGVGSYALATIAHRSFVLGQTAKLNRDEERKQTRRDHERVGSDRSVLSKLNEVKGVLAAFKKKFDVDAIKMAIEHFEPPSLPK